MTYLITYDLNKPGQYYSELYKGIKNLGAYCHPLDSNWFVVSSLKATTIRDKLKVLVDESDQIIVTKASAPAAWFNLSDEISRWLKENL